MIFPCKDGHICIHQFGGGSANFVASSLNMVKWMDEEGMAPEWLKKIDWANDYDATKLDRKLVDKVNEALAAFLVTKFKEDVFREGHTRKILIAPVNNVKDICESEQFKARDFWVDVPHPELGVSLTYCGPVAKVSQAPMSIRRRAPLIGEHNNEIYRREMGLSEDEMLLLKQSAVI